jgi:hypothetical protein
MNQSSTRPTAAQFTFEATDLPRNGQPHHLKLQLSAANAKQLATQLQTAIDTNVDCPITLLTHGTLTLSSPDSLTLESPTPIPAGWESV